jgi:hypothetical protein
LIVPTGPVPPTPPPGWRARGWWRPCAASKRAGTWCYSTRRWQGGSPVADLLGRLRRVLLVVHASRTPKSLARETTDDLLDSGVNLLGVVLNGCS